MRQHIIGIQVHHSVFLDDALRGAANACAGLDSAIVRTGDNDLIALQWRLRGLARELGEARDRSRGRLLLAAEGAGGPLPGGRGAVAG